MTIRIIVNDLLTTTTPFMKDVIRLLSASHSVEPLFVQKFTDAYKMVETQPMADLYLLRSHAPCTIETARLLEERGALVINSGKATEMGQDRVLMSNLIQQAHLPWPKTWILNHFGEDLSAEILAEASYPLIVKARYVYDGVYIDKVNNEQQLKRLAGYWPVEPVILQA